MAETKKTVKTAEVQRVPVYLRPAETGEQNFVRVVVNGKAYQIPRGRQQMVPRPVYEVLAHSEQAKLITRMYNAERVEVRQDRT